MRQWLRLQRLAPAIAIVVLSVVASAVARLAAQQQITITSGGPGALPIAGVGPGATPPKPLEAGTGLIFGQTVEGTSSRAVSGALVTLSVSGSIPVRVLSDGDGHYAFRDVPKGGFSITATKPGYSDGAYGRLRPDGPSQPLQLADGQRATDIALPMWKMGSIAGTVSDEGGEPIVGATVRVLKRTILGGRPQLDDGDSVTTDDRGMYRIGSLTPGDYVVVIPMSPPPALQALIPGLGPSGNIGALAGAAIAFSSSSGGGGGGSTIRISSSGTSSVNQPAGLTDDGHELWYQTTFYPTAIAASRADVLAIKAGQERGGVDFTLRPVRTAAVSGTLIGPEGPAASTRVSLVPADSGDLVSPIETANAVTDNAGHFAFPPVPSGQYRLKAVKAPPSNLGGDTQTFRVGGNVVMMRTVVSQSGAGVPPLPTTPTLWIDTPVTVGVADVSDLSFTLRGGVRVSGHIEFSGSSTQPTPDSYPTIGISLTPADGSQSTAPVRGRVEPSGTFATMGVPSGKYLLRVTPPPGWILRGAMLGGRDVSDAAMDLHDADLDSIVITFTDKPTSLGGTVTAPSGNTDPKATVIVFPQDSTLWTDSGSSPRRLRSTRTSPDGSYQVGLPAGDYFVAAVTDTGSFEWNDPTFLAALAPNAARVTVAEGGKHQQSLRTAPPPTPGGF